MGMTSKDLQFERILDRASLLDACNAIAEEAQDPASMTARNELFAALKKAVGDGRAAISDMLREDGSGLDCAYRLSMLQDEVIKALFGYATEYAYPVTNPSTSEHMALAAVGGMRVLPSVSRPARPNRW